MNGKHSESILNLPIGGGALTADSFVQKPGHRFGTLRFIWSPGWPRDLESGDYATCLAMLPRLLQGLEEANPGVRIQSFQFGGQIINGPVGIPGWAIIAFDYPE